MRSELAQRYAHNTVKLTMAYAMMILRAAHTSGRIGRDPTVGLKAPKARADDPTGQVGPEDVPTRDEALAILAAAPPPFRAGIALGLAGPRVGKVLGLTADRLVLESRRVTIDRQMQVIRGKRTLTTPKAEKIRTITVPPLVAVELRRHLRDHVADGVLFRGVAARRCCAGTSSTTRPGSQRWRWRRCATAARPQGVPSPAPAPRAPAGSSSSSSTHAGTGAPQRCSPRAPH